jgi:hypothetical protein
MGGKLFDLPRMQRGEYLEREAEVRRYLDGIIPGEYRIPRFYGDKPDFGDMDVLVASRPDWDRLRERFVADLGITGVKSVGHVYSTAYRGLQTDFFAVPAAYLDTQYDFMSFNDVGNFIGRMCRRFGLKWGERGLAYVYRRASGNYVADLEVSREFAPVCSFLGLDHAQWLAGFDSLEAVFDWVVASPCFSVAPYLDVRGDLARRVKLRPNVERFVAYLRERGIERRFAGPAEHRPAQSAFEERSAYLPQVIAAFPAADLPAQIERERAAEARAVAVAAKFSGKRVMQLVPGLVGEPLGEFIRAFRASFDDFGDWVIATPQDAIDRAIVAAAARRPARPPG